MVLFFSFVLFPYLIFDLIFFFLAYGEKGCSIFCDNELFRDANKLLPRVTQ